MSSTGQGLMRLKGVEVHLKGPWPQARLKLELTIDGRSEIRTFKKGASLYWESDITCTLHPRIEFSLAKHHRIRRWRNKRLAYIENAALTPDEEGHAMIDDPTGTLSVILSFTDRSAKDIEEDVRKGRDIVAGKKVLFDKLGVTRSFVEGIVKAADVVGDIHPAAKAALGALGLLIDACKEQEACRNAVEELSEDLELFVNIYGRLPELTAEKKLREAQRALMLLIANISTYIREHTKTGAFSDLVTSSYRENIDTFKSQLRKVRKRLDGEVQGEILRLVADTADNTSLNTLQAVKNQAYWKSDEGCLSGTRTKLLQVISNWAHGIESSDQKMDSDKEQYDILRSKNIFWLYGLAGSGKSTVAHTVAKNLTLDGLYLTCYFCARDGSDNTPPHKVIPTIAHQLAQLYAPYRKALVNQLSGATSYPASNGDIGDQRQYLFQDLFASGDMVPFQPVVIVIDGLDNCGRDNHSQRTLALNLRELAIALPWLRLVVTSRDRPDIRAVLAERCYSMDIWSAADTHADIRLYVESRIEDSHAFPPKGLGCSDTDVERLVSRANGLFEWCSVVFRFLEGCVDPLQDLRELLAGQNATDVLQNLYLLYRDVLGLRFMTKQDLSALRDVLGVIFVSSITQPLSPESIAHFLPPSRHRTAVHKIVQLLSPVLYCTDAGLVRAYHLSFLDYVGLQLGTEGWPEEGKLHRAMAISCLNVLHQGLKFNICKLSGSPLLNDDMPDLANRVSRCISTELLYGASFWMTHAALFHTPSSGEENEMLRLVRGLVCHHRVLFWLEVLTLTSQIERGVAILFQCSQHFVDFIDIHHFARDIHRFVTAYSAAMASTPHLYISALSWLPIRSRFLSVLPKQLPLPLISGRRPEDWSSRLWTQELGTSGNWIGLQAVQFLPQKHQILATASAGFRDSQILFLDADTGKCLWDFSLSAKGESNRRTIRIAVSPNEMLVAASCSGEIHIYNTQSRKAEHVLQLTAMRLVFSADGSQLVTASLDANKELEVCVWDTTLWRPDNKIRPVHDGDIAKIASKHVSLSPYGKRFVAVFGDHGRQVIHWQLWDVSEACLARDPTTTSGDASTLATMSCWSPDGELWSFRNGRGQIEIWRADGRPLRTVQVSESVDQELSFALAWSFNSEQLVFNQGTVVKVVETSTGDVVETSTFPHQVPSDATLVFSPNARQIAWHSNMGVHFACGLFDMYSQRSIVTNLRWSASDSELTWLSAFNHDGTQLVHASTRGIVQLHDVAQLFTELPKDGLAEGPTLSSNLEGPDDEPCIRTCSPDGQRLLLNDGQLLDTESFSQVALISDSQLTKGPYAFIDRKRLAATSVNNHDINIVVLDTHSDETPVQCSLVGHTQEVRCLSVSPDGKLLASWSRDHTARVWVVQSSEQDPTTTRHEVVNLYHNEDVASMALAPDGGRLVMIVTESRVTLIWSLKTREILTGFSSRLGYAGYGAAYSSKGTYIALWGKDGITILHAAAEAINVERRIEREGPARKGFGALCFSHDETRIAVFKRHCHLCIFSVETGDLLRKLENVCYDEPNNMAFSLDDHSIYMWSSSGFAKLYAKLTIAQWHEYCAVMDTTSGWVKDDDGRPLLWIPSPYRSIIQLNQRITTRSGRVEYAPIVNVELVLKVAEQNWARHFEALFADAESSVPV